MLKQSLLWSAFVVCIGVRMAQKKLGKAEWGYIAQYETKIYFENLEKENETVQVASLIVLELVENSWAHMSPSLNQPNSEPMLSVGQC